MCHSVGVLFCVTIIIQTLRHKHLIDLVSWLHIVLLKSNFLSKLIFEYAAFSASSF